MIHAAAKIKIRGQLESLGIRERDVFPDLEHLASDLSRDTYPEPEMGQLETEE